MAAIFDNPTLAVLALILGFGFLIFVHELGHFAVAKWVGIRATQFAIGFGHAIVSYRKGIGLRLGGTEQEYLTRAQQALEADGQSLDDLDDHERNQRLMEKADALGLGETEYRLNFLPLGGYVKMLGQEDMDPTAQSNDPRAFNQKSVGARAAVISAGVVMNLIFGLIFFMICFQMGVKFPAAVVGGVQPQSPAATAFAQQHPGDPAYRGLRIGDRIVAADGHAIEDMTGVKIATALGKAGRPIDLTVQRDGQPQPLTYQIVPRPDRRQESLLSAGIAPSPSLRLVTIFQDSPLAEAGIAADSTITSADDQPIETYGQLAQAFEKAAGQPVRVGITAPDGRTTHLSMPPRPALRSEQPQIGIAGLTPATAVRSVADDSPAQEAGLRAGDLLARLDDTAWPTPDQVTDLIPNSGPQGVAVTVLRDDQEIDLGRIVPRGSIIGIAMEAHLQTPVIGQTLAESPFEPLDLPGGSRILQINGQDIADWSDLQRQLGGLDPDAAEQVQVQVRLHLADAPTETHTLAFSPAQVADLQHAGWYPPDWLGLDDLLVEIKADGPFDAAAIGAVKTKEFIQQTYITLLRLFQGSVAVKNLRGPVGIVDEGSRIASRGTAYYLFFLGLISVNLAVLNFLPIPIVDGGLMVFLIIEKLKGSPASPKVQIAVSLIGLVGLACIFLYVTFNDISRIVSG